MTSTLSSLKTPRLTVPVRGKITDTIRYGEIEAGQRFILSGAMGPMSEHLSLALQPLALETYDPHHRSSSMSTAYHDVEQNIVAVINTYITSRLINSRLNQLQHRLIQLLQHPVRLVDRIGQSEQQGDGKILAVIVDQVVIARLLYVALSWKSKQ